VFFAGRTFVVAGAASGIGAETTAWLRRQGAYVIGVDRHPVEGADEYLHVELLDPNSIKDLSDKLPSGLSGLANIAGLPPAAAPGDVIKVNFRGLQVLTEHLIPKLTDGASIVNLASSAGNRWTNAVDQIQEFETVEWDEIEEFAARHNMESQGRSYFLTEAGLA